MDVTSSDTSTNGISSTYGLAAFGPGYSSPNSTAPYHNEVRSPGKTVLRFDYTAIQLNRLPWRGFVRSENPVASDRPKVKSECVRMLASLKLDPAKSRLIAVFVDSYLKLTAEEIKRYEREVENFAPEERKAIMELMTSWEQAGLEKGLLQGRYEGIQEGLNKGLQQGLQEGLQEGLQQGKENLVLRQIRRRFGAFSASAGERINRLTLEQLDDLGEALLEFRGIEDLDTWLDLHG